MAHIKAGGVTKGNRDSKAKRLGLKRFGGEKVQVGNILVRQHGTTYKAGPGTLLGGDNTIFAARDGVVTFRKRQGYKYILVEA